MVRKCPCGVHIRIVMVSPGPNLVGLQVKTAGAELSAGNETASAAPFVGLAAGGGVWVGGCTLTAVVLVAVRVSVTRG